MFLESKSAEDTFSLALEMSKNVKAGDIICLTGDLGAGKTLFSKGFAKGLLIEEEITSPTFNIVNIYSGRLPLYHFDVYRILNPDAMEDTGYEDYFYGDGVCLVEWAENIKEIIPSDATWITIKTDPSKDENFRTIEISE